MTDQYRPRHLPRLQHTGVAGRESPHNTQGRSRISRNIFSPARGLAITALAVLSALGITSDAAAQVGKWGKLANPGFEGEPMKSTLFFTGQWRFGEGPFYDGIIPAPNNCMYTMFPIDGGAHLGYSLSARRRERAVVQMQRAGVNVINMSWWGPPGTDRWAFWAPMQSGPGSYDELFDAVAGRPILIAPFIENAKGTIGESQKHQCGWQEELPGHSPPYHLANDFPGTIDQPAPKLVEHIVYLVNHFLKNPEHPEWAEHWAQMYDQMGEPRYVVALIQVGSNQPNMNEEKFAAGFDRVANAVYERTQKRVGFTLDVLPPETGLAIFKPSPKPRLPNGQPQSPLAYQRSVLAIQAVIPEVHTGKCPKEDHCDPKDEDGFSPLLKELIDWKRNYIRAWVETGIPTMLDVSSGRDAREVFKDHPPPQDPEHDPPEHHEPRYGNNLQFRIGQAEMLSLPVSGLTGNAWNGYTEGFALVPSCSFGVIPGALNCFAGPTESADPTYAWFTNLTPPGGQPARQPTTLTGTPATEGVHSDRVRFSFTLLQPLEGDGCAVELAPCAVANRDIVFQLGSQQPQVQRTNAEGVATVEFQINQRAGEVPLIVSFAGDGTYYSVQKRSAFRVKKETTRIQPLAGEVPMPSPPPVAVATVSSARISLPVAALLVDDDAHPVEKRTLTFALGSGPTISSCSALTDETGLARCSITVPLPVPRDRVVTIRFAGDAFYESATATQGGCPQPSPNSGSGDCPNN